MWNKIPSKEVIQTTIDALKANNMDALLVENEQEAKEKVLEMIPKGVEIFNATSITLQKIGLADIFTDSDKYISIRKKIMSMDKTTQSNEIRKLGAAPDWVIGSVHAITKDGHVMIASRTGSQLPSYINGSNHVVWVVGVQKIVKNIEEGLKRIYEYSLPLETKRSQLAYGTTTDSEVNKIAIINKEMLPGRINIIFVNEDIGF